jgi:hypothetical protein
MKSALMGRRFHRDAEHRSLQHPTRQLLPRLGIHRGTGIIALIINAFIRCGRAASAASTGGRRLGYRRWDAGSSRCILPSNQAIPTKEGGATVVR